MVDISGPSGLLLVSTHPLALSELRRLAGPAGAHATCRRFDEILTDASAAREAEICVVDACVPPPSRDALLAELLADGPSCRVLVLAESFDALDGARLLRMGVRGLIGYASAATELPRALMAIAEGGYWAPRTLIGGAIDSMLSRGHALPSGRQSARLSRREQEVLDGVIENLANKEIAQRLNISERTVKFHVSNLLSKFGVARRADLIIEMLQRPGQPH